MTEIMERMIPADTDAEEQVLGSILIDPDVIPEVSDVLKPSEFYREKNGWIYETCLALWERQELVSMITVAKELDKAQRVQAVGGLAYLSHLVATTATSIHARDYAELVQKCAVNRQLISVGSQIVTLGYANGDPTEAIGKAQEQLLAVNGLALAGGLRSLKQIADDHLDDLVAYVQNPSAARGTCTGYPELDATIGGFEPSLLYVLAARPSMGKSQLALSLSVNVARAGKGVAVFSLEMSELSVLFRLVMAKAKLNRYAVRLNQAGGDWQQRFWDAIGDVSNLPIWVDDTSAITTSTVRSRIARLKAQHGDLGLVVFDYGDLGGDEGDNEENRLGNITKRLAAIAKGLLVPVLMVCQLSRAVESRPQKQPQLADLRYSGVIEQRADVVMMLYRPAYYREMANQEIPDGEINLLEVYVRKQRDGSTGKIGLYFDMKTGLIAPLMKEG